MRRRQSLVLATACALLGFLLVTAASSAGDARRAAQPRKSELIDLIQRRRSLVAEQDEALHVLRGDVAAARRLLSRRSQLDRAAADDAATLAMQAGTVALAGKGLAVSLKDSPRKPNTEEDAGAFRIHDTDLQLVVNALFAAGAEAVAVNDSRLVATTPIRAAGDTIVVNFRPLSPPYKISAIGADRKAFVDSDIARRFERWTGLFGLGFSVQQREVSVPAYSGRVAITSAKPS
ncbi:MAG: DUF881 domain-containing protein [Acidimicrobiales bacterium]